VEMLRNASTSHGMTVPPPLNIGVIPNVFEALMNRVDSLEKAGATFLLFITDDKVNNMHCKKVVLFAINSLF